MRERRENFSLTALTMADKAHRDGVSDSSRRASTNATDDKPSPQSPKPWLKLELPQSLKWIPSNWTWSKIKPVIRCAVAAWVAAVLFIYPKVEVWMGQVCDSCTVSLFKFSANNWFMQASFLILIGEFVVYGNLTLLIFDD
jgi:hypothetical protein